MSEIWKDVLNSKDYLVSNTGIVIRKARIYTDSKNRVFHCKAKTLAQSLRGKGYLAVKITYQNEITIQESVHRLVAKAFVPNPNNYETVNHIDLNKLNNNDWNLEWTTNEYNNQHSFREGNRLLSVAKGERSGGNKFNEATIRKIPELIKEGLNYYEISKKLGMCISSISAIKHKKMWKHLNLEF